MSMLQSNLKSLSTSMSNVVHQHMAESHLWYAESWSRFSRKLGRAAHVVDCVRLRTRRERGTINISHSKPLLFHIPSGLLFCRSTLLTDNDLAAMPKHVAQLLSIFLHRWSKRSDSTQLKSRKKKTSQCCANYHDHTQRVWNIFYRARNHNWL